MSLAQAKGIVDAAVKIERFERFVRSALAGRELNKGSIHGFIISIQKQMLLSISRRGI
jgi:hypothetical protein